MAGWPHGSDWLCEAAIDSYLPLLEQLQCLAASETPAPITIGFTPVLANQLASARFALELEAWPVLAQAARELLLAQASDWQFIISTGDAADYAERRFVEHAAAVDELVTALGREDGSALELGIQVAAQLAKRDELFPDIIASVATVMGLRS